jgi:hypothetical protein
MPLKPRAVARYEYNNLPSTESIRLIQLEPGRRDDRLECRLITVDLNTRPAYEAVSYVWGEPQYRKSIVCDGRLLQITPSLHEVLQRFRDTVKIRVLWADAICINQNNTAERSHQVSLMGKIYSHAARVLIWLGQDEYGDAEDVFNFVHEMNEFYDDQLNQLGSLQAVLVTQHEGFDKFNPKTRKSLSMMMKRTWFNRVWVIQEVGSASRATIYVGELETEWAALMRLFSWFYLRTPYLQAPELGTAYYIWIDSVLYLWLSYDTTRDTLGILATGQTRNQTFLDILDFARDRQSSDPRDHIYAFLSHPILRPGMTGPIIKPAYNRSILEVYREFAINWLKYSGRAHLLSYVVYPDLSMMYNGFPTFVPQWNVRNPSETFNPASNNNGYNASKSSVFSFEVLGDRLLSVNGLVFNTVDWYSDILDWEPNPAHSLGPIFMQI